MLDPIPNQTVAPPVVEKTAVAAAVTLGLGITSVVLEDVPSIHGREVTLMITSTVPLTSVDLLIHGANKLITVVENVAAAVAAATPTLLQYTGGLGQEFDVRVTNGDPLGGTVTIWVAVRT